MEPMIGFCLLLPIWMAGAPGEDLPRVVLEHDDTVIRESCRIMIPPGTVIADRNVDGVLQIVGPGITVRFEEGSVLRGAPAGSDGDVLTGTGVRASRAPGLQLVGLAVHGYKVGLHLSDCDDLVVRGLDASDNFRQRLGSTPQVEDAQDWLYPHSNDDAEWRTQWGAALYVERSKDIELSGIRVRRGQNGIVLDRCDGGKVFDNDASFLSGWGLALWRSSDNTITRNAFDFCVRGYSHGVYNRGQDSAGILMFDQCTGNLLAENSCTHGGDGFFGFAGREALGESPPPEAGWDYRDRGNRDNVFLRNDFSFAAAHGFEQTFSTGNQVLDNRIVGNAICGIWGGYSNRMRIEGNRFQDNGELGYGLERGAINIEHGSSNWIAHNRFEGNRCSIHLWMDSDPGLGDLPWVRANHVGCRDNTVVSNRFAHEALVLHLREAQATRFVDNEWVDVAEFLRGAEEASLVRELGAPQAWAPEQRKILGERRPVGAHPEFSGREHIVMGAFVPWDHAAPMARFLGPMGDGDGYEVLGAQGPIEVKLEGEGFVCDAVPEATDKARRLFRVRRTGDGIGTYRLSVSGQGLDQRFAGQLGTTTWHTRFFDYSIDPREDYAGWLAEAEAAGQVLDLARIDLPFGMGGPRDLGLSSELSESGPGADHFGVLAETDWVLPAGQWRLETLSDDGIRVYVDGALLIDRWTHHGTTPDQADWDQEQDGSVRVRIECFELTGAARLRCELRAR
ncbi:MAG TPA: right-handed parallel beta-helix repeat-containing protein [Planctomycetota bacterium]|nr:right-handed parallel beta-helix repeat-containing protein [Planctomycetota bacterium]